MRSRVRITNIRELREKAGLTRRMVASRLFVGRDAEQRFAAYEDGKPIPWTNAVSLLPLAEALKCGVTDLKMEEVK